MTTDNIFFSYIKIIIYLGLSTQVIVGIIGAVLFCLILTMIIVYCTCYKSKRRKNGNDNSYIAMNDVNNNKLQWCNNIPSESAMIL